MKRNGLFLTLSPDASTVENDKDDIIEFHFSCFGVSFMGNKDLCCSAAALMKDVSAAQACNLQTTALLHKTGSDVHLVSLGRVVWIHNMQGTHTNTHTLMHTHPYTQMHALCRARNALCCFLEG